jgi:hypothetical protein
MMVDKIIEDGSLRAHGSGFSINARLPWYRSLPLSTVDVAGLKVDGQPIELGQVEFVVNGRARKLPELRDLEQEFWFVLDTAEIRVSGTELKRGSVHDIELELLLQPPYIKGLQRFLRWTKRLQVQ